MLWSNQDIVSEDGGGCLPLLPEDSEKHPKSTRLRSQRHRDYLWICCIAVMTLLFGILLAILISKIALASQKPSSIRNVSSHIPPEDILACGSIPSEARSLGCIFDVMDFSWTPMPCFNASLSRIYFDFAISKGLQFWNDSAMTTLLSNEEVHYGVHEYLFTTQLFHNIHCEYYVHRQSQLLQYGLPMNNLMRDKNYVLGCIQTIREGRDPEQRLFAGHHFEKCAWGIGDVGKGAKKMPPDEYLPFIQ